MENLSKEVLNLIFKHLDFKNRLNCSLVCKNWRTILISQGNSKLDDVAVVNIFEKCVYENIALTAKSRLKSVELDDNLKLKSVADHVGLCNSLKIWFRTPEFVESTLKILSECNMKMRCLDLYPYGDILPLATVNRYYSNVEALILRPHGSDYFWTGMPCIDFPDFQKLDSVVLDSLTLSAELQLPSSISQLEWSHRSDEAFSNFVSKISSCENLKYLLISHVQLEETVFHELLNVLSTLNYLIVVIFKFVKFSSIDFPVAESTTPPPLKVLKLDLCYGDVGHVVQQFLRYAPSYLQIVQINSIYEENQMCSLYKLVPLLCKRNLWLQWGVLQRQSKSVAKSIVVQQRQNVDLENGVHDENGDNGDNARPRAIEPAISPNVSYPPLQFRDVLCKLDLSFVEDDSFLTGLLSCGAYSKLMEVRFIQCSALTDSILELLAKLCVRLKKIYINGCDHVTRFGLEEFVKSWDERKSKELNICWRSESKFTDFSSELRQKYDPLISVKYFDKSLPNNVKGQKIVVWDNSKMLTIQDYSPNELHWIMGFVLP